MYFTVYLYPLSLPGVSQAFAFDLARQVSESIYRTSLPPEFLTGAFFSFKTPLNRAKKGHPPNPCILLSISNSSSIMLCRHPPITNNLSSDLA